MFLSLVENKLFIHFTLILCLPIHFFYFWENEPIVWNKLD